MESCIKSCRLSCLGSQGEHLRKGAPTKCHFCCFLRCFLVQSFFVLGDRSKNAAALERLFEKVHPTTITSCTDYYQLSRAQTKSDNLVVAPF